MAQTGARTGNPPDMDRTISDQTVKRIMYPPSFKITRNPSIIEVSRSSSGEMDLDASFLRIFPVAKCTAESPG